MGSSRSGQLLCPTTSTHVFPFFELHGNGADGVGPAVFHFYGSGAGDLANCVQGTVVVTVESAPYGVMLPRLVLGGEDATESKSEFGGKAKREREGGNGRISQYSAACV